MMNNFSVLVEEGQGFQLYFPFPEPTLTPVFRDMWHFQSLSLRCWSTTWFSFYQLTPVYLAEVRKLQAMLEQKSETKGLWAVVKILFNSSKKEPAGRPHTHTYKSWFASAWKTEKCVCVYRVRANERNSKDKLLGKNQDWLTFCRAIKSSCLTTWPGYKTIEPAGV